MNAEQPKNVGGALPDTADLAAARKADHIRLAAAQQREKAQSATTPSNDFDDVEFLHHALCGINAEHVDMGVEVGPWKWPVPLFINGMTGGTEQARNINYALATAAADTGAPIASGSVGIAIDDPETAGTFTVIREANPEGFVMANLGAGRPAEHAKAAVDLLAANALQLHVNAVQETIMPEGSRDFSGWLRSVEATVRASPVPVIVKEVGFGLSRRTLVQLADLGVQVADVSGVGGTNFARIEADRRSENDFTDLATFGQSAPACLIDAPAFPALLASGGVRSPLDVVRALALGAAAVGAAGPFLTSALEGPEATVHKVSTWLEQVRALLALLGAPSPAAASNTDVLLRGRLHEFAQLRGIDASAYAHRSDSPSNATTARIQGGNH